MKVKNYVLVIITLLATFLNVNAQESIITGTVTDDTGPLPGVSVIIKGTTKGTESDFDGKYSISAKKGDVLVFSYVGMTPQEKIIEDSKIINIVMRADNVLEEVVINVFGVEVKKNQAASSFSRVKSETIDNTGESDVLKSLSAKASNVNIVSNSGDPGSGSYVQIRGQNTITGNSQPLYVIDGIPVSNDELGSGVDGVGQQSRMNDLNPNDIEDIQILKGASASALWGFRAANGVVLITTKKGKQGSLTVNVSSTVSFDEPNVKFKTQNLFGQGSNGNWVRNSSNSYGDLIANRAGGNDDYNSSGAYFISGTSGNTIYPVAVKKSQANFNDSNYESIINKGFSFDKHISVSGGGESGNFYIGIGHFDQEGIIESSRYERTTIDFSSKYNVSEKTTFKGKFSFSGVNANRIQQGSNTSGLLLGLYRTPADFDIRDYIGTYYNASGVPYFNSHRAYRQEIGTYEGDKNPGYNNPLWTTNVQKNPNKVNRLIGGFELQHNFNNWISALARFGLDTYSDERISMFPINSVQNSGRGQASESVTDYLQYNADIMLLGDIDVVKNDLSLNYTLGINIGDTRYSQRGGGYINFLVDSDKYSYNNSVIADRTTFFNRQQVKLSGAYFQTAFDYKRSLFLTLGGRLETISTLDPNLKNYFYPSAEFAFKIDEKIKSDFITEAKLRAAYGQIAVNPSFGFGYTYYASANWTEPWGGAYDAGGYNGSFQRSVLQGNNNLKPEIKSEIELGVNLGFANRLSINATYYNNEIKDNLAVVPINGSSGYGFLYGNFADIENKGFEVEVNLDILKKSELKWSIYGNWATNENKVTRLDGTESLFLNGFTGTSSRAVLNQPLGVLWGGRWNRDATGNLILDSAGFPTVASTEGVLGDPNPDWRGGLGTKIGYKGFKLNVLFDASIGGDVWDGTNGALNNFGKSLESANIVNFPNQSAANNIYAYDGSEASTLGWLNIDGSYSVRGDIADFGDGPVLLNQSFYTSIGGGFGPVAEQFIKDASWIKLREVSMGYIFNQSSLLKGSGIDEVSFTLTGRNLWLWTKDKTLGQDPESNLTGGSNGRGLQYFNHPNSKSILASINIKF